MPKVYVRIDDNSVVVEIVIPYVNPETGYEYTVVEQFGQDFANSLIEVTGLNPLPECWWTYDGANFHPPLPIVVDPLPGLRAELDEIDRESIKLIRAMVIANGIGEGSDDHDRLGVINDRAIEIEAEITGLDT